MPGKIYWEALEHCPDNQLVKPTDNSDAGFDIRIAKTCVIKPMSEVEYTWVDKNRLDKLSQDIPELFTSINYDIFYNQRGIRTVNRLEYEVCDTQFTEEVRKIKSCKTMKLISGDFSDDEINTLKLQYKDERDLEQLRIDSNAKYFKVVQIKKYKPELIPTGIKIQNDELRWNAITLRSGMCKYAVSIPHSVGVIDFAYDGELYIPLYSLTDGYTIFEKGERIAQLIPMHQTQIELEKVSSINKTIRNESGFGSSGLN